MEYMHCTQGPGKVTGIDFNQKTGSMVVAWTKWQDQELFDTYSPCWSSSVSI